MTEQASLASREQLLKASVRRYKELTLPARGLTVRIQNLTERERADYERSTFHAKDSKEAKLRMAHAKLVVVSLVDAEGHRLLQDSDVGAILDWDVADVGHVVIEAQKHNAWGEHEIEEIVKNSETIQTAS